MSDQTPMDPARAALESLYYDQASDLCDLIGCAERGCAADSVEAETEMVRALADAHEAGRLAERAEVVAALTEQADEYVSVGCDEEAESLREAVYVIKRAEHVTPARGSGK